jgi:hypothetical protein
MYIRSAAILLIVAVSGGGAGAQSLADVARKEESRRKTAPAAKVYTNKDLSGQPAGTPAATAPPPSGTPAAPTPPATEEAKDKGPAKDQAYWSGRMKALQSQVERDSNYADAMQTRINSLTTDFVNRDDPAQRAIVERDRQKSVAELARLKKSIDEGKKAVADLEEEARRAGAPPGWLR